MNVENALLFGKDRALGILRDALAYSKASQTQVTLSTGHSGLTRFAGSAIHQNVAERRATLSVKAIFGKKIGFAVTTMLDENSVRETVGKAVEFARNQHENPDFVSLPGPKPLGGFPETFYESTATFGPEKRSDAVGSIVAEADRHGAEAAGSFALSAGEFAVANSLGNECYVDRTSASLSTVMTAGTGFGAASRTSMDVARIDPADVGAEAAQRAEASREPATVEAGEYDVVLLPYAVADLIEFLGYLGLGALAVQEGRSFMCGKFGQRICRESVTLWDDGLDPKGMVRPFDPEGVPKQRVDFIVDGVANAVVYDSYTANKEGRESTGHSTGGAGTYGPMPANLFLKPGDSTVEDMVASTKGGLLVSRFHYINVVHPIQTILTGMTRDGTFLIENGRIVKPVMNLRFTESVINALSNVEMIGAEPLLLDSACVPALKVRSFRFTGVTEF